VILNARDVAGLQHFLMDAAKRYLVASGFELEAGGDVLASAAALDYALLLASESGDTPPDAAAPASASVRETMTRAAVAALDLVERILSAPSATRLDFVERYAGSGGLFEVLRNLRAGGVLPSDDVSFRALTLASDLRGPRP